MWGLISNVPQSITKISFKEVVYHGKFMFTALFMVKLEEFVYLVQDLLLNSHYPSQNKTDQGQLT